MICSAAVAGEQAVDLAQGLRGGERPLRAGRRFLGGRREDPPRRRAGSVLRAATGAIDRRRCCASRPRGMPAAARPAARDAILEHAQIASFSTSAQPRPPAGRGSTAAPAPSGAQGRRPTGHRSRAPRRPSVRPRPRMALLAQDAFHAHVSMRAPKPLADRRRIFLSLSARLPDRPHPDQQTAGDDRWTISARLRGWYAEDLRLRTPIRATCSVAEAFAAVPREQFLGPGPWRILPDAGSDQPFMTPDDAPHWLYHDVLVDHRSGAQAQQRHAELLGAQSRSPRPAARRACCRSAPAPAIRRCSPKIVGPHGRATAVEHDEGSPPGARRSRAMAPGGGFGRRRLHARSGRGRHRRGLRRRDPPCPALARPPGRRPAGW